MYASLGFEEAKFDNSHCAQASTPSFATRTVAGRRKQPSVFVWDEHIMLEMENGNPHTNPSQAGSIY
jgi:hypothetical protein